MGTETPQPYNWIELDYATLYADSINATYRDLGLSQYGVSTAVIAGAILEELHDSGESIKDGLVQNGVDILLYSALNIGLPARTGMVTLTHADLARSFTQVQNGQAAGKLSNPTLIDIGPGNVQIQTAIRLLLAYNQKFKGSDPLNIKKYNNDYVSLVNDLMDGRNPATAKFAGNYGDTSFY
jgi:hypothetical protein